MSWDDEDFDVDKVVVPSTAKKDWDEPEESWEAIAAREAKAEAEKAATVPKNPNAGKPKEPKKKAEPSHPEKELSAQEALIESRMREQLVKDSDLKNAIDLFGADSTPSKKADSAGDLMTMTPQSEAEFSKFAELFSARVVSFSANSHYLHLVKEITKHVSEAMSVDDTRDVIKTLNGIVNDKIKHVKGGKSKAPAKKPVAKLNVKGGANEENFEDHIGDKYDDYADDFM